MSRSRYIPVLAAALLGAAASAMAGGKGILELQPPRPPGAGEALELQLTIGRLPQGARLAVLSAEGRVLGAVFPFGLSPGMNHTLPIPADVLTNDRIRIRLQVIEPDAPPRPPRAGEVEAVRLRVSGSE